MNLDTIASAIFVVLVGTYGLYRLVRVGQRVDRRLDDYAAKQRAQASNLRRVK